MKKKKLNYLQKIVIYLRYLLGIKPTTIDECRFLFSTARLRPDKCFGTKSEWVWYCITKDFRIERFSKKFDELFGHWRGLVKTEGHAKELFFVASTEEQKNIATELWLKYLSDFYSEYHRKMVAKLADYRSLEGTEGRKLAIARRMDFTRSLIQSARTLEELRLAYSYIYIDYCNHGKEGCGHYNSTNEFKLVLKMLHSRQTASV